MDAQAKAVGKWEDAGRVPEAERLTWFYPDFGCYVVKEFVSPERLAECARGGKLQRPLPRPSPCAGVLPAGLLRVVGPSVRFAETALRAGGAVTCWGAVLCRSPAFCTSGHFVPKAGWIVARECDILNSQLDGKIEYRG